MFSPLVFSKLVKMKYSDIPREVKDLWAVGACITKQVAYVKVSAAKGGARGKELFDNKAFGTRTVIGVAVSISDQNGTALGVTPDNEAILTYAQAKVCHLTFADAGGKNIEETVPLLRYVPNSSQSYVPLYLPDFNPSKSFLQWATSLANAGNVYLELTFYCL